MRRPDRGAVRSRGAARGFASGVTLGIVALLLGATAQAGDKSDAGSQATGARAAAAKATPGAAKPPGPADRSGTAADHPAAEGSAQTSGAGTAPPLSDDGELPEGHPSVDEGNPHAHAGKANGMPGVFQPPEDLEQEDPLLAPGTIKVDLRDPDDHPVAGEIVTLGMLINSVAKGDSRKHVQVTTDAQGSAVFTGLETASNIAYRISSGYRGGSFAASPFQLGQVKAMHVVLHVYPVTRDLGTALIVCEAVVAAELRDDRIQIEEALTFYNLGRSAWQPDDVRMALPEGFTAFNAQANMSDQGVDETGGTAKLRGTFPPGRHAIEFRWQLPWSGDKDVDFDVGLPPHVAIARVMMPATANIKLKAADFPEPELRHDEQGQTFQVTERRLRPDDAKLTSLSIGIHDLPTPGAGRTIASSLAACAVCGGLVIAFGGRKQKRRSRLSDAKVTRDALLGELAGLERAHNSGQVGPRTYERARRELLEALAYTLSKPSAS
jgi:hypothetical protein